MNYTKYKLGELLQVTRGASLAGTGYADEGRYLRLTLANIREEGGFKPFKSTEGKYFTEAFDHRFIMRKGDLITPLTEQSPGLLGSVAFVPCDDLFIQSQDIGLVKCNDEKIDKQFAYYLFLTHSVRKQISARSQQTKIRHTSPDKIADVTVYIPDLPKQLRIAGILGSLDEKIELNRRKIIELESLAKTIYDYWFVQYDFPDANGMPYKSSGGKMVYDNQLKREIPEGWKVGTIIDISNLMVGGTPSKKIDGYWNGEIPFWGPTDYSAEIYQFKTAETITNLGFEHCSSDLLPENAIIITARGSIGKVVLVGQKMAMNQSCFAFEAHEHCFGFVYFLAKQLVNHLKMTSTGSVFNAFVSSDLNNTVLSLGSPYIRKKYSELVAPLFESIKCCVVEMEELIALRNKLLPLLMNGQVDVAG